MMEYCNGCAELPIDFCKMTRVVGKDVWGCADCQNKTAVMKTVLAKIENLHTEMVVIKKGQEGQQAEQERVLEGIKVVETVVKRMEEIEKTQADHGERLLKQESSTRKNKEKIDETKTRTTEIERRLDRIDSGAVNVLQTNAVIRELREMGKKEKNFVLCNLPESSKEEAEERKKDDEKKVEEILKELKTEQIRPLNVIRVGESGRYPKKLLVKLRSCEESEAIFRSAEEKTLASVDHP